MKGVDLLIFGATRNTGLSIARLAVGKGERVAAMARKESDVSSLKMLGVTVVRGDAFEVHDCWQTLNETRPRRVISPVMAIPRFTVAPVKADTIATAMVMPAEGPSLGTAPSGKWTCRSLVL